MSVEPSEKPPSRSSVEMSPYRVVLTDASGKRRVLGYAQSEDDALAAAKDASASYPEGRIALDRADGPAPF